MLKPNSPRMQNLFQNAEVSVDERRRASLARKGKRLYRRHVSRPGIYIKGFVAYHLWCGEYEVARDFLAYLQGEIEAMEGAAYLHSVEKRRLETTRELAAQVKAQVRERLTV